MSSQPADGSATGRHGAGDRRCEGARLRCTEGTELFRRYEPRASSGDPDDALPKSCVGVDLADRRQRNRVGVPTDKSALDDEPPLRYREAGRSTAELPQAEREQVAEHRLAWTTAVQHDFTADELRCARTASCSVETERCDSRCSERDGGRRSEGPLCMRERRDAGTARVPARQSCGLSISYARYGARYGVLCAGRPDGIRTWCHLRSRESARGADGACFHCVQLLRLLGRHQTDRNEVEGADESVCDPESAGARDCIAKRNGPMVLKKNEGGG